MKGNNISDLLSNSNIKLSDDFVKTLENLSKEQIEKLQKIREILKPRRVPRRIPSKLRKKPNPYLIFEIFAEIIKEWIELQKIKEIEKTKRALIQAEIERLRQATRLYIETFNKIFNNRIEERQKVLDKLLEIYTELAKNNNWQTLHVVGQQILQILSTPIITPQEMEMLENIFDLSVKSNTCLYNIIFEFENKALPDFIEI